MNSSIQAFLHKRIYKCFICIYTHTFLCTYTYPNLCLYTRMHKQYSTPFNCCKKSVCSVLHRCCFQLFWQDSKVANHETRKNKKKVGTNPRRSFSPVPCPKQVQLAQVAHKCACVRIPDLQGQTPHTNRAPLPKSDHFCGENKIPSIYATALTTLQFLFIAFHSATAGSCSTCCPAVSWSCFLSRQPQTVLSQGVTWFQMKDLICMQSGKKLQDIKDNCHMWLNGVQGGKIIMKHSFHWIATSTLFF